MTIESEIFKTPRAGFIGKRQIGRAALYEWMQSIDDRVKRLESALNGNKCQNIDKQLELTKAKTR